MTVFHVMIPARLESTRLPRKALADLGGKPMVVRVWERACGAGAMSVHVATDNAEIEAAVERHGGRAVRTEGEHDSGTSRIAEAVERLGFNSDEIVVNVQGDEPALPPACIAQVANLLESDPEAMMATLWVPILSSDEWRDPGVVKVVVGADQRAMYFSRSPIPASRDRDWPEGIARRHVGLYAYRSRALWRWAALPESALAAHESLEQLRALEGGWGIACARACEPIPPGVDTPRDLEAMQQRFAAMPPARTA